MKGYIDPNTETLLKKRKKLLGQLEVVTFHLQEINKEITCSLFDSLGGKKIRFGSENTVYCVDQNNRNYNAMPYKEDFAIIEAGLNNTMDDIFYICRSLSTGLKYKISQHEFNSFTFID